MFLDDLLKPDSPAFTRGFMISLVVLSITAILLLYFANLIFILLVSILFFTLLLPLTAVLCAPLWVKIEDAIKMPEQKSPADEDKTIELMDEESNKITPSYVSDYHFYKKAYHSLKKSSELNTESGSEEDEDSTEDSETKNSTTNHLFYSVDAPRLKITTCSKETATIHKQQNNNLFVTTHSPLCDKSLERVALESNLCDRLGPQVACKRQDPFSTGGE